MRGKDISGSVYYEYAGLKWYYSLAAIYDLKTGKHVFGVMDPRTGSFLTGAIKPLSDRDNNMAIVTPSFTEGGDVFTVSFKYLDSSGGEVKTSSWRTATGEPVKVPAPASTSYLGDASPGGKYIYCIYNKFNWLIPSNKLHEIPAYFIMKTADGKELWRKELVPKK
jgi:hypothetical protein